ncbi:hypothetical protein K2173_001399 [Erythroxylum novogranatense]|uniref:Aquaporin NIP-type n=1 Tax=Erythroxylum novogranatense TaxID=1862640 RepID=A0AAV8T520_9ROSI|nr:hypothetical protein K2173_001399 [Erythroxylum novogranatense]
MAANTHGIEVGEISKMEEGTATTMISGKDDASFGFCSSPSVVSLTQMILAEFIGTYFLIFAGCGSVAVNKIYGSVTFPGICVTWGLTVMVLVYTLGHVSGAHFNPAVTFSSAVFGRFPWWQVPYYIGAQLLGSILASGTLALVLDITPESYFGTVPVGPNGRSLVLEILISFILMFVNFSVSTDHRANGDLGGIAVGMIILVNVLVAGPVSGASMNPARSIGPAIVKKVFKGLWVYIIGPIIGTVAGGFAYNLLRPTDKTFEELTRNPILKKPSTV